MYLVFNVKGMELERTDKNRVANESVNFLKCKFYFETVHGVDEWDTLNKRVHFIVGDGAVPVLLDRKNECEIPVNVLDETNYFKLALVGVDDEGEIRVTTNPVQVNMEWSDYAKKLISSEEPSKDILTEILGRLSHKFDSAELMGDYLVFSGDGHELCRVRLDMILEETDPIFMSSPAANIKDSDIAQWNGKIDHVNLNDDNDLVFSSNGRPIIRVSLDNFLNSQADWSETDKSSFSYIREKPDLYDKKQIDTKIKSIEDEIKNIVGFQYEIVPSLDDVTSPKDGVIYCVRVGDDSLDHYDEFIYLKESGFERLGSMDTVKKLLTKYALASDVDSKQDKLVSGTNIRGLLINQDGTVKKRIDLLGAGYTDINLPSEQVQANWNTTIEADKSFIVGKPDLTVYAKTEEMNKAIAEAIKGVSTFEYRLVDELPDPPGEHGVIYLVLKTGTTTETYDMYLWLNDDWRHIGNSAVDLSKYATRVETINFVNNLLQSYTKLDTFNEATDDIYHEIFNILNKEYINDVRLEDNHIIFYTDEKDVAMIPEPVFEEEDPVFLDSWAATIDGEDIRNWNAKFERVELENGNQLVFYGKGSEHGRINLNGITEEKDPIFTGSPAYSIKSEDINIWNNKYDEARLDGNQLMFYSDGELKKTIVLEGIKAESDPVFKASPAYKIQDSDIEKWNKGSSTTLDEFIDDLTTEIMER